MHQQGQGAGEAVPKPGEGLPRGTPEAAPFVAADLPCAGCGYNLRSLAADAACPECGTPVARSVADAGGALHAARPGWLRSLAVGAALMLAAQLLVPATFIVHELVYELELAGVWVFLGIALLYAAGVWVLTRRERLFRAATAREAALRAAIRACVLGLPAAIAVAMYWGSSVLFFSLGYLWWVWALATLTVPGTLLTYLYLRRLALRVPSRWLAAHALIVGWGGSLSAAAYLGATGYSLLGAGDADDPGELPPGLYVMLGGSVGMMLFFLWSLVLLTLFVHKFARAARASRQLWRAGNV